MIMKQTPLIMAEFEKAFSEVDHDVVNILLHTLQNILKVGESDSLNLFNYEKLQQRKVVISAASFKELGKFGKNANEYIFESLKKISDTSAVIHNFTDKDNKRIKKKNIRVIDTVTWYEGGALDDKRDQAFEVQFNEWFLQIATKQFNVQVGNYTKVELPTVSSLKSKHAKKLYEILKSQEYQNKSFALRHENMQRLFNLEGKDFSYIVRIIKTAKPKVEKLLPFEFTPFKKDKLISFKILVPHK